MTTTTTTTRAFSSVDLRDAAAHLATRAAEHLILDLDQLQADLMSERPQVALGLVEIVERRMADLTHALRTLAQAQRGIRS